MARCQKRMTPKARLDALMRRFEWISCPDPRLAEAIDYLSQHPGKQLRCQLTQACAELIAREPLPAATIAGEAIELLHTYSLVHDDLPAMDDDDLRRGQPTPTVLSTRPQRFLPATGYRQPLFSDWQRSTL